MGDLEALLEGCTDNSLDDGIRIDTELVPLAGPGGPIKPAVYEGGVYQQDRRWAAVDDPESTPVRLAGFAIPAPAGRACAPQGRRCTCVCSNRIANPWVVRRIRKS